MFLLLFKSQQAFIHPWAFGHYVFIDDQMQQLLHILELLGIMFLLLIKL
jgi:hypothetical protein